jgi:hypothetical protein
LVYPWWTAPSFFRPYVSQIVESRSIVNGAEPGPAPAAQALPRRWRLTASSWRTWPQRKAAQERAQGGGGLDAEAQDPLRAARAQGVAVVDAVAARERRHQERQELVPGVRPAGGAAEVEEPLDESLQAEMRGQGGRQQEARVGYQLRPVERRVNPVEAVGRSHPAGAPLVRVDGCVATPSFPFGRAAILSYRAWKRR